MKAEETARVFRCLSLVSDFCLFSFLHKFIAVLDSDRSGN